VTLSIFEALVLGLAQGLSEFLPISSSGHLALLSYFFGIDGESALVFAVMLHVGTLISVLAVYRKDVLSLLCELLALIRDICTGKGLRVNVNPTRKLGFLIIAATIPTGLVGFLFRDIFTAMYSMLESVGVGFLVTGTILIVAERVGRNRKSVEELGFPGALFVGTCQGIAIWPGLSRSGTTIFGSLISGLSREAAVKFAFLISIPAIMGSAVLEAPGAFSAGIDGAMWAPVLIGMTVSAVSGFIAIKTMIKVVSRKKLYYFSIYTWGLGVLVLLYALVLS